MEIVIAAVLGFVAGCVVTWFYSKQAIARVQALLDEARKKL